MAGVWLGLPPLPLRLRVPDASLALDDTCFCDRCVERFGAATGLRPWGGRRPSGRPGCCGRPRKPGRTGSATCSPGWWRRGPPGAGRGRPGLRLGLYGAPWRDEDYGGALRRVLGNDLDRLHALVDVFSPMLYQVKCGRPVGWVEAYTRWLVGRVGGLNERRGGRVEVWPIVEAEGATAGRTWRRSCGAPWPGGQRGAVLRPAPRRADPQKLAAVRASTAAPRNVRSPSSAFLTTDPGCSSAVDEQGLRAGRTSPSPSAVRSRWRITPPPGAVVRGEVVDVEADVLAHHLVLHLLAHDGSTAGHTASGWAWA